jgi:hypothetical protein
LRGAKRASSFAIFGLRVGFVRIANVLELVRGLERTYQSVFNTFQLIYRINQFDYLKSQLIYLKSQLIYLTCSSLI